MPETIHSAHVIFTLIAVGILFGMGHGPRVAGAPVSVEGLAHRRRRGRSVCAAGAYSLAGVICEGRQCLAFGLVARVRCWSGSPTGR